MTGTTRATSSPAGPSAWPGRLDAPPTSRRSAPSATIARAWSRAAAAESAVARPPRAGRHRRTSPGVTLRTPITYVRSPQSKVRGPMASGRGAPGRPSPASAGRRTRGSLLRRPGPGGADDVALRREAALALAGHARSAVRIAEGRVVDEARAHRADQVQRAGDDDRPAAIARACPARRPGSVPRARARPARPARQIAASSPRAARGGGRRWCTRRWRRRASAGRATAATTPATSLSAIDAQTSVSGPEGSRRRRRGTGAGRRAPARGRGPRPGCGHRRGGPRVSRRGPDPRASTSSRRPGQRALA